MGATLPVGDGEAFVIGDEPLLTCWISMPDGGAFARWAYAEDEHVFESYLKTLPASGFEDLDLTFEVVASPILLFDSVFAGSEIARSIWIDLKPGAYAVSHLEWTPDEETGINLIRLRRC